MNKFVISLIRIEHNYEKVASFYLQNNCDMFDLSMKFGLSTKLRGLLGWRWVVRISKTDEDLSELHCHATSVQIFTAMIRFLESFNDKLNSKYEQSLIIKANYPK